LLLQEKKILKMITDMLWSAPTRWYLSTVEKLAIATFNAVNEQNPDSGRLKIHLAFANTPWLDAPKPSFATINQPCSYESARMLPNYLLGKLPSLNTMI